MFIEKLRNIIQEKKTISREFIRNVLKVELIWYVLEFIYTSEKYKDLIFKGGTCLSLCYDLPRLSEDIDLDSTREIDPNLLREDLILFFKNQLAYDNLNVSITNHNNTITLKFPILHELGITSENESDLLYVKIDLQKVGYSNPRTEFIAIRNYVINTYPLSILFSGKINAIFMRNRLRGHKNLLSPKGRDYFDLLWFLQKGIKPELDFIDKNLSILSFLDLKYRLDMNVDKVWEHYKNDIITDLSPFIEKREILDQFISSFLSLYYKYSIGIFDYTSTNIIGKQNYLIDEIKTLIQKYNCKIDKLYLDEMNNYEKGGGSFYISKIYENIFQVKFLEDKANIRNTPTSSMSYVLFYTINFPAKGIIDLKLKVLIAPHVSVGSNILTIIQNKLENELQLEKFIDYLRGEISEYQVYMGEHIPVSIKDTYYIHCKIPL